MVCGLTLFNPNLGELLGIRFEVGFGGDLKLEIWDVNTHSYVVSKNIPFSTKVLLILLMSEK